MIHREPGNETNFKSKYLRNRSPIDTQFLVCERKFYQLLGNRK